MSAMRISINSYMRLAILTIALVAAAIAAGGVFGAPPAQAGHDPETLPIDIDGWARTPAPTIA
ncbi:MAG: hypothetical protein J4O06_14715, partial [Chloroflexi bacterium]|nr:hypothetical protein [Chloroflexota bacterium]